MLRPWHPKHFFGRTPGSTTSDTASEEVLSARYWSIGTGVVVHSGRTGTALLHVRAPSGWSESFLTGSVDWHGKRLPDLVTGSNNLTAGQSEFCILSMEDHCVLRHIHAGDVARIMVAEAETAGR